jgi:hypothetical protein
MAGRRSAVEHFSAEICAETHIQALEAAIAHRRSLGWRKRLRVPR